MSHNLGDKLVDEVNARTLKLNEIYPQEARTVLALSLDKSESLQKQLGQALNYLIVLRGERCQHKVDDSTFDMITGFIRECEKGV